MLYASKRDGTLACGHECTSKAEYGHNTGNEDAKGTALSKRTKVKL